MTDQQRKQIIRWYRAEYRNRTARIRVETGRIDWLDRCTRVSLTEVRSYAESIGVTLSIDDTRNLLREPPK